LIHLGSALATELVGLVTLPATPTGRRPPALWQYYSVQIRRSIRSSRDEVGEVLEVVKSSENTLTILFALEFTASADMMLIGITLPGMVRVWGIFQNGYGSSTKGSEEEHQNTPPHTPSPASTPTHAPPYCTVMCPCKSLRLISGPHHRFRLINCLGLPISARGDATPRAGAAEVLGQCFASVDQCAVAQTLPIRRGFVHQRDHAPHCKSFLCCRVAHRHFSCVDLLLVLSVAKAGCSHSQDAHNS